MPRIHPLKHEHAQGKAKELLDVVKQKLGGTPNILTTMAHSPAALESYLSFSGALGNGTFPAGLREQIALAVAGASSCEYCAAAHTAIGKGAGVPEEELALALDGQPTDPKAAAAVRFARTLVEKRGWVSDEDIEAFKAAGFDDGQVMEIVAVISLNIYTNLINHVAQTDIDFPKVAVPQQA
ncbi:MAG: carboxymuconolactone decarboxylase family protein [Planctomycetota bacterium]|nr:carboxymuconolactone decarboxylase family protein [Planctomycetota bacterium]